jgi:hypothetical protein
VTDDCLGDKSQIGVILLISQDDSRCYVPILLLNNVFEAFKSDMFLLESKELI